MPFRPLGVVTFTLVVASAFSIGCASRATTVDDAAIQAEVKAKLKQQFRSIEHRQARELERGADLEVVNYIDVNSSHGQVVLTGEVRSRRAKEKAEQIAKSVPHVSSVVNQLAVAPGYSDDAGDKAAR